MSQFTIDAFEKNINFPSIDSPSFKEFCSNIDDLKRYGYKPIVDYFIEAVTDNRQTVATRIGDIATNTASTTKNAFQAADALTDIESAWYKTAWNTIMKAITAIANVIKYISNKILIIPNMIVEMGSEAAKIPGSIRSKIRGDLQLFVTIDDIEFLYNKSIMSYINSFIATATALSKGDLWGTMFAKRSDKTNKGRNPLIGTDDIKLCKRLKTLYNDIKSISFSKSTIDMKNLNNINAYFGAGRSVEFKDLSGKQHTDTYYVALAHLVEDIIEQNKKIENSQLLISAKYNTTLNNTSFANLSRADQRTITNTIQMVASTVSIVGSISKYVVSDMNTIKAAYKQISKKYKLNDQPE